MLQYENRGFALFLMLFRVEGSCLPPTYTVAMIPAAFALLLEFAAQGELGEEFKNQLPGLLAHPFACQVFAIVLGYVVVFRTNMALNRYWEGCTQVLKMYAKLTDCYSQLVAFCQSSMLGKSDDPAVQLKREKLEAFMDISAHWCTLFSACAVQALRTDEGEDIAVAPPIIVRGGFPHITAARGDDLRKYVYYSMVHRLQSVDDREAICSPVLLYAPPKYVDAVGSHFVPPPNIKASKPLEGSWLDVLRAHEQAGMNWTPEELAYNVGLFRQKVELDMLMPYWSLDILGMMPDSEARSLDNAHEKCFLIASWVTETSIAFALQGWIQTPPPILGRSIQEMSQALLAYNQALKITVIPFPFPFTQMVTLLLTVFMFICPFMVTQFTKSLILSPLLTFFIMTGYWGLNEICAELENPYGEDANDIPLLLMHKDFVTIIDELRCSRMPTIYESLFDESLLPISRWHVWKPKAKE